MAKSSGLGDNCYVGGYDLSGDIGALSKIACPVAMLDVTGINQLAFNRIYGLRDGAIDFMAYFNPSPGQEHVALSTLPRADTQVMYTRGTTLGNPAAAMTAKQLDYNPTRANNGALTFQIAAVGNGYGLEWGKLLTAGKRTDTVATNGTSLDGGAATNFGMQAYLQVFAFTGIDVTIKLQDSADNITFADLAGAAFTQITSSTPSFQRVTISNAATVRRYVRAVTVTTGGFTSATFSVMFNRNLVAGTAF